MAVVLGIDTAGPVVGVALWSDGVQQAWSMRVARGADGLLMPEIARLIDGASLDAVAVAVGPGAFTGLRVGVATALGVAFSRGVPVVPLSALLARAALVSAPRVLALLDARKSRVYCGLFDATQAVPTPLSAERDAPPEAAWPDAPFVAVGEGAVVYADAVVAAGGELALEPARCPAGEVARLGALRLEDALDPGEIALRYLREPDAQPPRSGIVGR